MATDGSVFASSVNNETYVYSNYLTFDKNLGEKHTINAVAGMEFNKYNRRYQNATSIYFPMIPFKLWMAAQKYLQVQGMKPIILCFSIWPSKLFL
jgi:hypothetical protein